MHNLYISMPGGSEWILILIIPVALLAIVALIAYNIGYRNGRKTGEPEAYKRMQEH